MKNSIWYQCKRKKRYKDEHMANYYRRIYERERGQKLDYYWCTYCKGFHLTSVVSCMDYAEFQQEYLPTAVNC